MKLPTINLPQGAGATAVKIAGGLVVLYFGIKFVDKKNKERLKEIADSKLDKDPAAGQARKLNAAMNRSGNNWMRSFDGTNDDAIYETAAQITNYESVKNFYKAQTEGRILGDDLISEIGADGFDKFLALASQGKTGSPKYAKVRTDIEANRWLITIADAFVRKTPKKESRLLLLSNIVKLVKKDKAIGVTTGKFVYDESNDTTFLEFYTLGAKTAGKHFFYVAKSQVEAITNEEKIKREKTNGKIPLELLAGLSGISEDHQTQAVSTRSTIIYNEQFKAVLTAPKNIIIGFPLLALDTGKGKFLKFETIQGNVRWVNAEDINIQQRL